ncbi:MAG: FAD-binding protein [bacterium]
MKKYTNYPLKKISWIKIGGDVKEYIEAESSEEFKSILIEKIKSKEIFEVIGWGSNTLFSDKGLDYCLIKNKALNVEVLSEKEYESSGEKIEGAEEEFTPEAVDSRHEVDKTKGTFRGIEFKDLDYDESAKENVKVKIDSGVSLAYAMNYLIDKGITGLQWFAGIPGTIGGAIYNNIHGGTHSLSEYLSEVEVVDKDGNVNVISITELGMGYEKSRFQKSGEIIVSGTFNMKEGDKEKAKYVSIEWARRKISQPRNSLGSVFRNISKEDQVRLGFPTPSIGYLVEHELKLSGYKVGDAMVCPTSNNFIVNLGNASSEDYLEVIRKIKSEAKSKFNLELKPEIFFKGFSDEELKGIL